MTKIEDCLLPKYIAIKVILGHFHFKVHKIIIRIHKGNLLRKTLANGIENIAESKLIGSVQKSKIFFNLSEKVTGQTCLFVCSLWLHTVVGNSIYWQSLLFETFSKFSSNLV